MARHSVSGTVGDPTVRFATLELAGEVYHLAYNFNAIAEAESLAGCNLLEGLESLTGLNARQFRGLLYAALAFDIRTFTQEGRTIRRRLSISEAGDLIAVDDVQRLKIAQALAEAYRLSMPEKKADPPVAGPAAEN